MGLQIQNSSELPIQTPSLLPQQTKKRLHRCTKSKRPDRSKNRTEPAEVVWGPRNCDVISSGETSLQGVGKLRHGETTPKILFLGKNFPLNFRNMSGLANPEIPSKANSQVTGIYGERKFSVCFRAKHFADARFLQPTQKFIQKLECKYLGETPRTFLHRTDWGCVGGAEAEAGWAGQGLSMAGWRGGGSAGRARVGLGQQRWEGGSGVQVGPGWGAW